MTDRQGSSGGCLIALEGLGSHELRSGAQDLLRSLKAHKRRSGFSLWDASSIFHELSTNVGHSDAPSAKTLLILYAADLAFRLRWEIEPALADGYTVVAAPYVRTSFLVGRAAGLSSEWLSALFEFAPKPEASYWVRPSRKDTELPARSVPSFPEFSFRQMKRISNRFDPELMMDTVKAGLEKDARLGRLKRLR